MQAANTEVSWPSAAPGDAAVVDRLLSRFADSAGRVSERALLGVAELCGLSPPETDMLRSRTAVVPEKPNPFGEAVAAAHRLMEEDRYGTRPDKRLLTAVEEVGLSVILRGGAEHAGREPERDELAALSPSDVRRRARNTLVLHNQKLVHAIMRSYPQKHPALGYDDMAQEAMTGLMRAARKFDPTRGLKFSTYATWWIRQSIDRARHDQSRTIRIPVHMVEDLLKLRKAERGLAQDGHEPDTAEIAAACGWTVDKVETTRSADWRTTSLDTTVSDDTALGELLGPAFAVSPADRPVVARAESERIRKLLGLFPPRDAEVLERNLGLFTGHEETLECIASDFNVTRERIRQIRIRALKRLREAYEESPSDPHAALALNLRRPSDSKPSKKPNRPKGPR